MIAHSRLAFLCAMCVSCATLYSATPTAKPAEGIAAPAAGEIKTAQGIPSLPGFVRSPYTQPPQLINVMGAKPGSTLVCPYTQKPFIVPADFKDSDGSTPAAVLAKDQPEAGKALKPPVSEKS